MIRSTAAIICAAAFAAFLLPAAVVATSGEAEARTNNNYTSAQRSAQCSRRAQERADRETRRNAGRGAAAGATIGGLAGRSWRGAGIGAAAGAVGGAVMTNSSRWQTIYNREYRACINR
jgi:uncharacterized protein YcfJ